MLALMQVLECGSVTLVQLRLGEDGSRPEILGKGVKLLYASGVIVILPLGSFATARQRFLKIDFKTPSADAGNRSSSHSGRGSCEQRTRIDHKANKPFIRQHDDISVAHHTQIEWINKFNLCVPTRTGCRADGQEQS